MLSTTHTASSFLIYFDQQTRVLSHALSSAIEQSDTVYARLVPEQQQSLARHLVVALREAATKRNMTPLLAVLDTTPVAAPSHDGSAANGEYENGHTLHMASGDPQVLFALLGQSAFDTLKPWGLLDPVAGAEGMAVVADVLVQAMVQYAERRVREAQLHAVQQEQLYGLARVLGTVNSLGEVVDIVVRYFEPLGATVCTLYLYEGDEHGVPLWAEAVASWQLGFEHSPQLGLRLYMPDFPFSQIALAEQLIAVEDAQQDERLDENSRQMLCEMQLPALLSAPLILRGHQLGRVWLTWSEPRRFTPQDLRLINTVASLAPAIIERLQLQEEARRRLEELTRLRDSLEVQVAQRTSALHTFYTLAENAPDGIGVAALDGTMTYANPAFQAMIGQEQMIIGMSLSDLFAEPHTRIEEIARRVLAQGAWEGRVDYRRHDGSTFLGQLSGFAIRDTEGRPQALVGICRNLTEQVRAEEERNALQEQVIAAQQAALRELSTPIIPLADDLVVMPLVGTIDSSRSQQVIETLLEGVSSSRATTAILDITGVLVVDTQVANGLLRAAQAVKLLGAQVIITGIRPEVAQTLVGLGLDLSNIVTRATLQSGIAFALAVRSSAAAQGQPRAPEGKQIRW
jgi:PAS domain S-box-containing protein